ncbi:neuraminidase-like domain-containing protein [Arthrobacter sp. AL08]|uniref:Tc toxin subunit A-related protein n=1 Tax=unclassified Arthrobacter TaxID=235627 RepID=UPI00249B1B7B|nr:MULTISPECIES: neuraminidase-like domain-containing protein [unclassified Arthrobacter]MDI3243122.1 neuraminidase-like domain-containing protein [Arthrobacter sp. AL05]MDI3279138.1 neuraminidase-like domain-containing protein [Arthrobacter sp. AL08]
MNRDELLRLDRIAGLAPGEVVDAKDLEVVAAVQDAQRAALGAALADQMQNSGPPRLWETAKDIDLSGAEGPGAALMKGLLARQAPPELIAQAKAQIDAVESAGLALANLPLGAGPLVRDDVAAARMHRLAEIAVFDPDRATKLVEGGLRLSNIDDTQLDDLVGHRLLTVAEATSIGLATSIYRLVDEDTALAGTILKTGAAGGAVATVRDLVDLNTEGWKAAIATAGITPPGGMDADQYALLLAARVEATYPTGAVRARLAAPVTNDVSAAITTAKAVLDVGADVLGTPDLSGVSAQSLPNVQAALGSLAGLAGAHRGLGLEAIMADATLSAGERAKKVGQRVSQFDSFLAKNADVELVDLDLTPESADVAALDFGGVAQAERPLMLRHAKVMQRVFAITGDATDAAKLMSAGFDSATALASAQLADVITRTGLSEAVASRYYDTVTMTVGTASALVGSIIDMKHGGFGLLTVANADPSIEDYFKQIDGYEDLFGSQAFCACQNCKSITGPAAYFVDLMHFIEEHLLSRVFTGALADHVLNLKTRRPELWTLPLTCDNTTNEIPQLVIVNEILETYLAKRTGFAGDTADRIAVERAVYRDKLASAKVCFGLPFSRPLYRTQTYLEHFGVPRSTFVRLSGGTPDQVAIAGLGLSLEEATLITTANTAHAFLDTMYGQGFDYKPAGVTPFDAQTLLRPMSIAQTDLAQLVSTRFVSASGAEPVTIVGGKLSAASVQNDIERVTGLKPESLDRMHRFTRLWRACPGWSIRELDLVVGALTDAGLAAGIDAAAVRVIAELQALQQSLGGSVEDLLPLFTEVPTSPVSSSAPGLFDRLFNLPDLVAMDGPLPLPGTRFVHPALRDDPTVAASDHMLHRLLAATRTDASGLFELIAGLAVPLGANPAAAAEAARGFALTASNLALLVRHARLAKLLKMRLPDLFRLLALLPSGPLTHVGGLNDLRVLLATAAWARGAKRSVDDLASITGAAVTNAAAYPAADALAKGALDRLAADRSLTFTDTVFTLAGVSEAGSRALVAANPAAFDASAGQLALSAAFTPTTVLTVPAAVTVAEPELRAVLLTHHAGTLLKPALAALLKVPVAKLAAIAALAGADLDAAAIVPEALGNGSIAALSAAVGPILPLVTLFNAKALGAEAVEFAAAHASMFALQAPNALTIEAARKVDQFRRHLGTDPAGTAALTAVAGAFTNAAHFGAADQDTLAALLAAERAVSVSLQANLALPADALDALDLLAEAAAVATAVGIGGEAFALVAEDDYDLLSQGADALFAVFRAKYADETAWQKAYGPFRARLLERCRDALANYLVHALHPEFERLEDLFRYFLIDPEVEGCFLTSRVVSAISSAQMYVHRVLMNLEQDRAGNVHVQPTQVPRDEWEWRMHYRVWEANRKVFLWPENYLFPDLRDDKTPLFEDLEKELLQTDIDEQAVLDAYGTYLDGFQELASLTIAGSYQEVDPRADSDVLHLFGVTPGDPATFYYRRVENAAPQGRKSGGTVWGPWQKVDVAIPVREVSPVVHNGRLHLLWAEITTSPVNEVADAGSRFAGYNHKLIIKFTTLRLDGRWTAPQRVRLYGTDPFGESDGVIEDPLAEPEEWQDFLSAIGGLLGWGLFGGSSSVASLTAAQKRLITPRYDDDVHVKARDGYTLRGLEWTQLYPEVQGNSLFVAGAGYQMRAYIDTFDKSTSTAASLHLSRQAVTWNLTPHSPILTKKNGTLYYGTPSASLFDNYALAGLAADKIRLDRVLVDWSTPVKNIITKNLYVGALANIGAGRLMPINGSLSDGIIDAGGDLYLLQATASNAASWALRRLGTTLARRVARELFTGGVEHLLDLDTQRALAEAPLAFGLSGNRIVNRVVSGRLDFTGPFGTYYREIFHHIPSLIGNHCNSQGKYAQAERWYQHIFDPTTSEVVTPDPVLSASANEARRRDRNWRYLEFRGLTLPTMRAILTDSSAIAAYHKDPFNPHAIARLRLSAYQKSIVMRYIDNKLDLADSLFEQFQMETVNEALIHYATVADILGDRPAQLGSCGPDAVDPRTYEKIQPLISKGSEFLVEAEHLVIQGKRTKEMGSRHKYVLDSVSFERITKRALSSERLKAAGVFSIEDAGRVAPDSTKAVFAASNAAAMLVEDAAAVAAPAPAPPGRQPADPRRLFERRAELPVAGLAIRARLMANRIPRFETADIDSPAGLAGLGRTGTDDLYPEAIKERETERADIDKVFVKSVGSVDAGTRVLAVPPRKGLREFEPDTAAVSAGPDWKRLGAYEGKNRLRPDGKDRPTRVRPDKRRPGRFGVAFIRQVNPVFCIPPNKDLLAYWDRLEDRLWKLRNCRDISGAVRKLSLFAAEIDPMALVRARAEGMSLQDALTSLNGDVPQYRFSFLLEKAKSQATAVQGFGNALQAAVERRDGEQLNLLRAQHQQQILDLTTRTREQERDAAANAVASLERHRTTVANRKAYFDGLVDGSLTASERTERISKHIASGARMTEATLGFLSGALHLIPQLGSPFAMKYGGVEAGWSAHNFAVGTRATGDFADALATSAAVEAGFDRREQGWKQQVDAAADDLAEIDLQLTGMKLRRDIAERNITIHTRAAEQAEEVLDLYENHFTGVGLYAFLATTLQRLHREAFNTALSMARMAEQAFRFERGEDSYRLGGSYWDSEYLGLSAGAQLVVDLQQLERRYVETNIRDLEIDQSFSVSQLDPTALVQLKTTGECAFDIPEVLFDVVYPGHYFRRIKSARITIPCVTGPFANVSATLQLNESWIRKEAKLGAANVTQMPDARAALIATSTAQSDPGVFELNFRDERYMPFEGAGAISSWQLTLPKSFRQFDYGTINDVVLRLAYTSKYDGVLRDKTEALQAATEGTILNVLANNPLQHVVSLRNQFSNTFNALLHSPAATDAGFTLMSTHLPYFLNGRGVTVSSAKLALRTKPGGPALAGLKFSVDGTPTGAFAADPTLGGLPSVDVTGTFANGFADAHVVRVVAAGGLAPAAPVAGDQSALDGTELLDVMFVLELAVA